MEVTTRLANYDDPADARTVSDLLNGYALDQFGNSGPLDEDVRANLCAHLAKVPGAFSVVASVGDTPVGLINAFQGFSTFKCKPLINVHDVFVDPAHRRKGVTQAMMAKVEEVARAPDAASSPSRCSPTTRSPWRATPSTDSDNTSSTRRSASRSSGRRSCERARGAGGWRRGERRVPRNGDEMDVALPAESVPRGEWDPPGGGNECEYKTTVLRTTPRELSTPRVSSSRGGTN